MKDTKQGKHTLLKALLPQDMTIPRQYLILIILILHLTGNNHQIMEDKSLATETIYPLGGLISYSEKAVSKKVIARKKGGDIILLAFQQGQVLKEHTAPVDALVLVLEGKCLITIAGERHKPEAGQMIILPANIPHAVAATEGNFKMLLTKIKD